jgi:hypothetical protein
MDCDVLSPSAIFIIGRRTAAAGLGASSAFHLRGRDNRQLEIPEQHQRGHYLDTLYHSDRLLSLMLGLPYVISDAHCTLTFDRHNLLAARDARSHSFRLAHIAGKIIDQAQ